MTHLPRRDFLAGTTALLAAPALAQPTAPWTAVSDRARGLPQCHALAVHQQGAPVLQEVFRGPALGRAVPVKSVSKTLVASLLGVAIDRGEIPSVQATLGALAPGLIPADAEDDVAAITVEDLVTMRAGLERTSGGNYGAWVSSANWVADALSRPMVARPGGRMLYSTGSFHVLGAVLASVTGQSLLEQARSRLGAPLGIDIPAWTRDPQGRYLGGNEMALSLPAMVRFGEMVRQGGAIDGTRVLSADWLAASLEPRTRSPFSGLSYGYGWFLGDSGGQAYALARGYGGQVICIVPGLGLTIALTSNPTQPARSGGYFGQIMALIEEAILPAARAV
ncbi:serine hydrolase domain-containing protein [Thalassococcus sp. BH17M4-6]|uniref:serine hydrolase domain-containing protein n=1 Tax=Thalassococcus sp. BH17M4-6 TaxID=3413148 RepID=UPI003BCE3FFA